jgi:dTDP-4-amino-4,6-dideoxygalactose transaminase
MAGWKPRFADIDPETGLTTLEHIKLRWTPLTRAVLFIHLYGHTADLTEIEQWCREKDLVLIEDNAQALGAVCQTDSLWAVLDKCHSIVSILRRLSNAGEELW